MHIGRLIKQQLEAQDKTVSWLARELAYCRTNIYKIFDKKSIDTDLLEKPRDFDPFGQTGFAHLWLQYDCPFKVLVLGVNFILPF